MEKRDDNDEGFTLDIGAIMRGAASFLGIVLIIAALVIALQLFFQIKGLLENPSGLDGWLTRWQSVLARTGVEDPTQSDLLVAVSPDGQFQAFMAADAPTSGTLAAGASTHPPVLGPKAGISVTRVIALLVVIMLLGMLVRLALAFVKVGIELLGAGTDYRARYRELVQELTRQGRPVPRRRTNHFASSSGNPADD